jgi:hypothetical protein
VRTDELGKEIREIVRELSHTGYDLNLIAEGFKERRQISAASVIARGISAKSRNS